MEHDGRHPRRISGPSAAKTAVTTGDSLGLTSLSKVSGWMEFDGGHPLSCIGLQREKQSQ